MVKKVFCYSKDEARKNGCYIDDKMLKNRLYGWAFVIALSGIASALLVVKKMFVLSLILRYIAIPLIFIYLIKLGIYAGVRNIGFVIDSEGKIYRVSMSLGYIHRTLFFLNLHKMERVASIMSNEEIVGDLITGGNKEFRTLVCEILKVHSYMDKKKSIKLICDYKMLKSEHIEYNKTLTIYKAYNCFDDLRTNLINKK